MGRGFMMIFPILKQNILSKPAKNLLNFHHFFIEKIGLLQGRLIWCKILLHLSIENQSLTIPVRFSPPPLVNLIKAYQI